MNFFRQRTAQTLSEWLEIATGKLVPSAQARVRSEIEAHYAEAVQSHMAAGATEPAAQAAALADLGDAKAAARRLGRNYLTKTDAEIVTKIVNDASRDIVPWGFISLLILVMYWLTLDSIGVFFGIAPGWVYWCPTVSMFLIMVIVVTTRVAAYILAGLKITPAIRGQLVFMNYVSWLMMYACFLIDPWESSHGLNILILFVVAAPSTYYFLRLRRKLQSAGNEALPPGDPARA